jgi:hypothetical protein
MAGTYTPQHFSVEMESQNLFTPGWPGTTILLISDSQVVRISTLSHPMLAKCYAFIHLFLCIYSFFHPQKESETDTTKDIDDLDKGIVISINRGIISLLKKNHIYISGLKLIPGL